MKKKFIVIVVSSLPDLCVEDTKACQSKSG